MPDPPKNFRPDPFDYHEELELTVDSLTNLGVGVARHEGWVIMIPFTIPGERIRGRIFRNHKNYSDADLIEVLTPSPHRVAAPCPLFGNCGGCQYQHLAYPEQLAWKQRQVSELLQRHADLDVEVSPVVASPEQYAYRSKITPHFQRPRPKGSEIREIGFLRHGLRQKLVDVESCPITTKAINTRYQELREQVRKKSKTYKKGATLLLREASGVVHTDSKEVAREQVGDLTFEFLAGDFFQNNPSILPEFVQHAAREAASAGARFLVDAYCGSGLFTLSAASHFEQVAGVEISESSADWARKNAEINGITNTTFHAGSAESIFAKIAFPGEETAVLIDPPRKGCDELFTNQLLEFSPRSIVYVSCNPATQIRDLKPLTDAGYVVSCVQPFDLFPQTRHLECVATLRKP